MKQNEGVLNSKVRHCRIEVQTGDYGIVRSARSFFGMGIRYMTSRGLHRPWGNHNFPIWIDPDTGRAMVLDIAPPKVEEKQLAVYLQELEEKGHKYVVCRPDSFLLKFHEDKMLPYIQIWKGMIGKKYDKKSIRTIVKMYFRFRKHVKEDTKEDIYCTEGTFSPFLEDWSGWTPDMIKGEKYLVPLHSEHIVRQGRAVYVAGNEKAWNKILKY